jgi:sortase A
VDQMIRFLQQRAWARRGLSALSVVLLFSAVGMLGYPVYTNFRSDRIQGTLDRQIASPVHKQAYATGKVQQGEALTRIKIPALGVDTVVVEGVSASALRAGAGHYPDTPLPCEAGNVAIAGHRTTYGKPFSNVDRLQDGDEITLETPLGSCLYKVSKAPFIVEPTDFSVVANDISKRMLTLTTCHPRGSAAKRLIVQASFVKETRASA